MQRNFKKRQNKNGETKVSIAPSRDIIDPRIDLIDLIDLIQGFKN